MVMFTPTCVLRPGACRRPLSCAAHDRQVTTELSDEPVTNDQGPTAAADNQALYLLLLA
jgi:hypothetical protein